VHGDGDDDTHGGPEDETPDDHCARDRNRSERRDRLNGHDADHDDARLPWSVVEGCPHERYEQDDANA